MENWTRFRIKLVIKQFDFKLNINHLMFQFNENPIYKNLQ